MCVWRNNEARSCNHCCSGKAISVTCSECVFIALGIQYATRMRHVVICGQSACTQYFYTLSHKQNDFGEGKLLNTKFVLWFSLQLLSETFLILRRTERDIIKNIYRSVCKSTGYCCQTLMKLGFSRQILEKISNIKFHKNPSSEIDGETWRSCHFPPFWVRA